MFFVVISKSGLIIDDDRFSIISLVLLLVLYFSNFASKASRRLSPLLAANLGGSKVALCLGPALLGRRDRPAPVLRLREPLSLAPLLARADFKLPSSKPAELPPERPPFRERLRVGGVSLSASKLCFSLVPKRIDFLRFAGLASSSSRSSRALSG